MAKEIAVFLGADGLSASLDEPGRVTVFRRAQGSWKIDREMGLSMGGVKGMHELRLKMAEIIRFMDGCTIFVARAVSGVPYFELEKAGCGVWEVAGEPADFLEDVWKQEEKERALIRMQAPPAAMPVPEEKTPGNFYINIKELQGNGADVSSKQVLQKFIRRGDFVTLVIICGHVPPWIEVEAMGSGYLLEAERLGKNEYRVKIAKKAQQ
ncbi:Iron only nitrogenase protein AnfO [Methanocella conradii HZ254]|uniref:Iron only nitrogenase protein AnfO n=1 Tax=Methanocella conradii (strain DSM 24694 / JCM 17849 / CGMCC 1.5162 / HZ254) TaxID=1041930 RepID=H8I6M8_METCZ|nr:Fe-only nitrogenase accessory AnfO family protein [Methanocella conradii]AFC98920.1 Iron only nitrogenase protein AnfO [Methanocella conradii HZ254]MDI6898102.1 Fe-only nitrogenase accessory AnfO family protein [Methanocella conradii]